MQRVRGISLIELLVATAVIAIAIALVIERGATASRDQRRQQYVQGIQLWMDSTRHAYSELGTFSSASVADLRRLAPGPWQVGATVAPPIGGTIVPSVGAYLSLPGGGIQLQHSALPRADCGSVATDLQAEMVTLTINGTTLKSTSAGTFTRQQAETACNRNPITFTGVFK